MSKQTLQVLPNTFAIHSLDADADIPAKVLQCDVFFIGKTLDELSIIAPQNLSIGALDTDFDWRVLEVLGPVNLSLVGIMAEISNVLAKAKVSILVLSTFETDFFLVKNEQLANALTALKKSGYRIDD